MGSGGRVNRSISRMRSVSGVREMSFGSTSFSLLRLLRVISSGETYPKSVVYSSSLSGLSEENRINFRSTDRKIISSSGLSSDTISNMVHTSSVEMLVEIGLRVEIRAVGIVGDGVSGLVGRDESRSEAKRGVTVVGVGIRVSVGVMVLSDGSRSTLEL